MKKRAQKKLKHKPNARHTLSEVLHSLQDMMNNELAHIAEDDSGNASTNAAATLTKEDVMNSLKALIGEAAAVDNDLELLSTDEIENKIGNETESILVDDSIEEAGTADANDIDKLDIETELVSSDEDNKELHEASESPTSSTESNTSESADDFKLEIEEPQLDDEALTKKPNVITPRKKGRALKIEMEANPAGEQTEINWDDIPVLHEVVAPPPEPDAANTLEARKIAIKVAAALNIESRKKGGDAMDIKTIMRLQSLLSQELQDRQDEEGLDTENNSGKKDANDDDG